jgi:DNA-binding transcriptional ArsR family regulator
LKTPQPKPKPAKSSPTVCSPEDHSHRPIRKPAVDDQSLERAARIFRAIGDVPRLRLLALLSQGEACVTELASAEQDGLSTVSQRLRVLRGEHLVIRRRRGKHLYYALSDQHIVEMLFNALAHASEAAPQYGSSGDTGEDDDPHHPRKA